MHASDDIVHVSDSSLRDTPDFGVWPLVSRISGATLNDDGGVTVRWSNGSQSTYHRIWLRDNCPCPACHHPVTRESVITMSSLDMSLRPVELFHADDTLTLVWGGDRHISTYDAGWLEGNMSEKESGLDLSPRVWGEEFTITRYGADQLFQDRHVRGAYLETLLYDGIALVEGLDTSGGKVVDLASLSGFVRATTFGKIFHVINRPEDANTNANLAVRLPLHTDLPTREYAPGLQFLHALVNETTGGENMFCDGLRLARVIKEEAPEHYEALTTIACTFQNRDRYSDHRVSFPIIRLDHLGRPFDFRINTFLRGAITNLSYDEID
ncbi:MAG: TauD/TfdA family dioxygenase, partial [Alphaproteobacteria bacterium]|nr:TauD/TfdA family dioxygenase [Alphaproteobacteria bacterium]